MWWKRLRKNPLAWMGATILVVFYGVVLCTPWITPYNPNDASKDAALLPPTPIYWYNPAGEFLGAHVYPVRQGAVSLDTGERQLTVDWQKPSRIRIFHGHLFDTLGEGQLHLLGTDDQGRDQLTRLLYGGRVSLTIGLISTLVSFTLGCLIGAVSGYFGGWLDSLLMGSVEVIMSIPTLYLLVALTAILPDQMNNVQRFSLIVALLSLVSWAGLARVIRGQVMGIKQETFITAARSTGASDWRIIWRHILPQTSTYIVIAATSSIPSFTIAESVLSLIGLGIRAPDASWGNMLSLATNSSIIVLQPWLIWSPAILIVLTVLAYNLLGDGLRDALDPKHNQPR
jgi:peptide/nickel transport system permease protein